MKPEREPLQDELEAAGVDPDGFHEEVVEALPAADPTTDAAYWADLLLRGHDGGASRPEKASPLSEDRPSGVYRRAPPRKHGDLREVREPGAEWVVGGSGGQSLLAVSVREIGCFLVRPLTPGRWKLFNRLTGSEHVTYGTWEELDVEYARQTASWQQQLYGEKKRGQAFRGPLPKKQG